MVAPYLPEPVANPLERAIEAALADPAREGAFGFVLLTSEIYVVPTHGQPADDQVFGRDTPFDVQGVVLSDGTKATALFTAPHRAAAVFGDAPLMAIRGQHALEIMAGSTLIVNPGSPPGLVLTPDQSLTMLASMGDAVLATQTDDLDIGLPAREPTALIARLAKALPKAGATAAWLAEATDRQTGARSWRLDVRAATSLAEIRSAVDRAIVGMDFLGQPMALQFTQPGGPDGMGLRIV